MKITTITKPNQKGQIVIPQKMRDAFGIDEDTTLNIIARDQGIYVYVVDNVENKAMVENSYIKLLKKTQGIWAEDSWPQTEKKKKATELKAATKRRKQW